MECRVCGRPSGLAFVKVVLGRHRVRYYRCAACGYLGTEEPHWTREAYAVPQAALDTALVARLLALRAPVCRLIQTHLDPDGRFLDFGGGPGLFVRLMRDLGYDFRRQDKYAENVFARGFDLEDLAPGERRFELVTAFEVLEHLPDPVPVLRDLLAQGEGLLFSTELQPGGGLAALERWPYLGTAHGQHVSFYGEPTLHALAGRLGVRYARCGTYLHLLSRRPVRLDLDGSRSRAASVAARVGRLLARAVDRVVRGERYWLSRRASLTVSDHAWHLSRAACRSE